jgi:hypothetical protein
MRKNLCLGIYLLLFCHVALAQMTSYYPNGRKTNIKHSNIKELLDSLNVAEYDRFSHSFGEVIFKKFTKKPIAVIFWEKPQPDKIQQMIAAYGKEYKDYLYSSSYYSDLKSMMDSKELTEEFVKETFGKPDLAGSTEDFDSLRIFKKYNLSLYYKGGEVSKVNVFNYLAQEKHKVMLAQYEITGEDYSIGFNVSVGNYDKRTIKYVFFSVTAFNPVDDVVGKKTVRAVGPIEEDDYGTYEFENVIFSNTATQLSIDLIKIQYMDGTQRIIPKTDITGLIYRNWEKI